MKQKKEQKENKVEKTRMEAKKEVSTKNKKKPILIIGTVILAIVLVAGGLGGYYYYISKYYPRKVYEQSQKHAQKIYDDVAEIAAVSEQPLMYDNTNLESKKDFDKAYEALQKSIADYEKFNKENTVNKKYSDINKQNDDIIKEVKEKQESKLAATKEYFELFTIEAKISEALTDFPVNTGAYEDRIKNFQTTKDLLLALETELNTKDVKLDSSKESKALYQNTITSTVAQIDIFIPNTENLNNISDTLAQQYPSDPKTGMPNPTYTVLYKEQTKEPFRTNKLVMSEVKNTIKPNFDNAIIERKYNQFQDIIALNNEISDLCSKLDVKAKKLNTDYTSGSYIFENSFEDEDVKEYRKITTDINDSTKTDFTYFFSSEQTTTGSISSVHTIEQNAQISGDFDNPTKTLNLEGDMEFLSTIDRTSKKGTSIPSTDSSFLYRIKTKIETKFGRAFVTIETFKQPDTSGPSATYLLKRVKK